MQHTRQDTLALQLYVSADLQPCQKICDEAAACSTQRVAPQHAVWTAVAACRLHCNGHCQAMDKSYII